MMRIAILSAALAATTLAAVPATAQGSYRDTREQYRENLRENRQAQRQYRRDLRDWRQYRNYDYNRPERGQRAYYADQYYRDGSSYRVRSLGRNDRVYAGSNGRYYCRRPDGTTGLIIGGLAGGALGNVLTSGNSSLLGTLLGAGGGALLGRSVERGQVRCR